MKALLALFVLSGLVIIGFYFPMVQYLFWGGAVVTTSAIIYLKHQEAA